MTKSKNIALMLMVLAVAGCDTPITEANAQTGSQSEPEAAAPPTTDIQKASYSVGFQVADNLKKQFATSIDAEALLQGVADRMADRDSVVSAEEATASLQALAAAQQVASDERATENRSAGSQFLIDNGARDGVVTLPSGLQYEILTPAEGPSPTATDQVTTHYHGTLVDGTVFDSSYDRGQPATFPLNGVIPGWTEALQLMSIGEKWRLFIPPELAYGPQDRGPIPGNSTLIFDVELLEIGAQ